MPLWIIFHSMNCERCVQKVAHALRMIFSGSREKFLSGVKFLPQSDSDWPSTIVMALSILSMTLSADSFVSNSCIQLVLK